ncbi:CYTH and CHAD domain-containing protein [Streptomyces cinnamoneus]|uniref:CYTH and CHAD domain-containing protein n=1 Tax=Streptomyces cinnamoneus TaxID=53446 RepID=UPI000CEE718B|nr:CYTH and CHAD domain-containing protein [Streptomyces cinnamoneus]PPT13156.1 metal-binding protein [Streptomyces cinnamoneus]
MADTVREIERKYEAGDATGTAHLPGLAGAGPVARVTDPDTAELDAVYYDTADRRLAAAGITLRRRTGGTDAGWHLKLPVASGTRDEIRAPLSDDLPRTLTSLVRARTRDAPLAPLVHIATHRETRHLLAADGTPLAEASADAVTATRLTGGADTARWSEIEIELAAGQDPALLDALEPHLRRAGLRPSAAPSKLARALKETGFDDPPAPAAAPAPGRAACAGDHVLAYLREQVDAVTALDAGARRGTEDAVHQMRVATRRLRSAFRTYGKVLDRHVTDPLGDELKWLAGELGVARDREVLAERLREGIDAVPRPLVRGPVRARLRIWSGRNHAEARRRVTAVLDGKRYLALLDALDTLLADPPLRPAATRPPGPVFAKAVLRDYERLAGRVEHALSTDAGQDRDVALHEARKAAKRARYAAEAATPALGKPAKRFARRMKDVQSLLGDHQDSVVARAALRTIAGQAALAGEDTFTYGLLYGREERRAADDERELPRVWAEASDERWREGPTA